MAAALVNQVEVSHQPRSFSRPAAHTLTYEVYPHQLRIRQELLQLSHRDELVGKIGPPRLDVSWGGDGYGDLAREVHVDEVTHNTDIKVIYSRGILDQG